MRYTDKKKKKPSKTSQKRERDREQAEADAIWNEFYAQLIEYGMLHDTYQVPRDFNVETDEGRSLPLGQWLHTQGQKLNEYSRTNPQWYSDILDLIETGKLWFDNDANRTSPTNFSSTTKSSLPKASSSSSQPPVALDAFIPSIPVQKTQGKAPHNGKQRDYAMASTSDEEDSDNSMMQHAKHERSPSPPVPAAPLVPDIHTVPRPSRSNGRSPTAAITAAASTASTTSTQKKPKNMVAIFKANAGLPEVGNKRKGPPAAPLQLPQRAAKTRANKAAYRDASDSEQEEMWENDFDDLSDGEGSLAEEQQASEDDEGEEEMEEAQVLAKPAAQKPSRSAASSRSTTSVLATTKTTKPVPILTNSIEKKTIHSSHSAFAAAVLKSKEEKDEEAALKVVQAWRQKQQQASESSSKSSQPAQTVSKSRSATPYEHEKSKPVNTLGSAQTTSSTSTSSHRKTPPIPPTIPTVQPKTATAAPPTLPQPAVIASSSAGLMRPEQCMSTAPGGVMPLRRTMSRPKPVLAPVPTPPPLPQLAPRTPAASKDANKTAPPLPPTKTKPAVPGVPSGSLPHAAAFEVTQQAPPSTTEKTFTQILREQKMRKEAEAAGHGSSSPRSDISIAGSDLPPNSLTAVSKTGPAFPAPRGAYTGVDLTKKRSSISEAKQAAVRAAASNSDHRAAHEDDDKHSPRSTGTASNYSGSSPPPLVSGEALETPDEAHSPRKNEKKEAHVDGTETETEDDGEEEEEEMKIIGGRRGVHRVATPRRLDDFGSQQTPPPDHAADAGGVTPESSGGPMEVIGVDSTTAGTDPAPSTAGASNGARGRAHSVLSINSDTTAGNDNGENGEANGNGCGTDVDASDDEETEDEEEEGGEGKMETDHDLLPPQVPAVDPSEPQYYLQMSDESEEEDAVSVEDMPDAPGAEANGAHAQTAEFVAFAYTRSSSGPQCPMLGIGMVCNADLDANDSLYLIVMVPEDAKHPVTSEFRMDPDEFITVQRQLVLARDLTFVDGGRGGVFDEVSQNKIRRVLDTYPNLQIDSHFL